MRLKLITEAVLTPITLAETKQHLKTVDINTEDDFVTTLIKAATNFAQEYTYRQFITATYEQYFDEFPANEFKLEKPALQSVTSIKYQDSDSAEQTLSTDIYEVNDKSSIGTVRLKDGQSYPATDNVYNAIIVRFKAGYGDSVTDIPDLLRSTLKLMVSHLFENREFVTPQGKDLVFPSAIFLLLDQFSLREFI